MIYQTDDVFSRVSWNGSCDIGEPLSVYVPVPEIDASDGGAGVTGGAEIISVFGFQSSKVVIGIQPK